MKVELFQRLGHHKVFGQAGYRRGTIWRPCQSKCGKHREVEEKRLVAGTIKSCVPYDVKRKMEKFSQ